MKRRTMRAGVLLMGAMMMVATAGAQKLASTDLGLTVDLEHSQVAQTGTQGFWLKGGTLDGAGTFYKGLGLAASFGGSHARIGPGVTLGKYTFMAGPRYIWDMSEHTETLLPQHKTELFTEALFGMTHGFDALFPSGTTVTPTANGFAMQIGGGANLALQRGFGIRVLQLDYVHTNLPNNAANSQNDFKVAFGLTYHLKTK